MRIKSKNIACGIFLCLIIAIILPNNGRAQSFDPNGSITFYLPFDKDGTNGPHGGFCPEKVGFPSEATIAAGNYVDHPPYGTAFNTTATTSITFTFGGVGGAQEFLWPRGNSNAFTVAFWVYINNEVFSGTCIAQEIFTVTATGSFGILLQTQGLSSPCSYFLAPTINVKAGSTVYPEIGISFDKPERYLPLREWVHVAAVWDGKAIRTFTNGVSTGPGLVPIADQDQELQLPTDTTYSVGNNGMDGTVDDFRFYDIALDEPEITAIMNFGRSLNVPSLTLSFPDSVALDSAPQVQTVFVNDSVSTNSYYWLDRSACHIFAFGPDGATGAPVDISIFDVGPIDMAGGVYNNELCTTKSVAITVSGSLPSFLEGPSNGSVVYRNEASTLSIKAGGFPRPYISWERQVTENFLLPDGSTTNQTYYKPIPGQNSETLKLLNTGGSFGLDGNSTNGRRRSNVVRATGGEVLTVQAVLRDATTGTLFRSDPVLLTASTQLRPPPPSGDGGGDGGGDGNNDDVLLPAIIVPVVVGACICCCCLLLLLLLILLIAKKRDSDGSPYRIKLEEPDYVDLAYGRLLEPHHSASRKQMPALNRLEMLMINSDFAFARAICENAKATEADGLAKIVTYIYASHNQAVSLVQHFTTREVEASNKEGTLFRANSMASKMFTTYARIVASPYVWAIFARPVAELDAMAQQSDRDEEIGMAGMSTQTATLLGPVVMEVDPSKMEEAADDKVNTLQLWLVAQKLFNALESSTNQVPSEIRQILKHVNDEVAGKFSEGAAHKAMGGFLFLRLLCPSLMAPQVYGLLAAPPHAVSQRQLILLAKVMQNLANDTLPGKKEQYMARLNEFITSNQDDLRRFYATLIKNPDDGPRVREDVPSDVRTNATVQLFRYINNNRDRTLAQVSQEDPAIADELRDILDEIGDIEADEDL